MHPLPVRSAAVALAIAMDSLKKVNHLLELALEECQALLARDKRIIEQSRQDNEPLRSL